MKKKVVISIIIVILILLLILVCVSKKDDNITKNELDQNSIVVFEAKDNSNIVQTMSPTEKIMYGLMDSKEYIDNLNARSIDNVTIEVKEDSITRTGATFVVTDKNKEFCTYGDEYHIEVKKNGKWEIQMPIVDSILVEAYVAQPTKSVYEIKKDWSKIYGELENGEYRFALKMQANKEEYAYTEFTISL